MKIIFYLFLCFSLVSCNSSKRLASKQAKTELSNIDSNYRFNISFISIGSGTDGNAKKMFESYLSEFESSKKLKLVYEISKWGREGEVDYCFKLDELKVKEQETFIQNLKEVLKNSKLVRYQENSPCKKGR